MTCTVAGAVLSLTGTTEPAPNAFKYPYTINGTISGGALSCQGPTIATFTQAVAATSAKLSRAILAADLEFILQTPVGEILLTGHADDGTGTGSVAAALIEGSTAMISDPQYVHVAEPWNRPHPVPTGTFRSVRP